MRQSALGEWSAPDELVYGCDGSGVTGLQGSRDVATGRRVYRERFAPPVRSGFDEDGRPHDHDGAPFHGDRDALSSIDEGGQLLSLGGTELP
jgi:hypothetical protein